MSAPRVISGSARGIRLKSVPGDITRPITDRVKESLFNIIGADIQNASFLDLFAGTGSVGIEALSRGAEYVRFNDIYLRAVKTIRENLARTNLFGNAEVYQRDAFDLLRNKADRCFDYIYIAPPQYRKLWIISLQVLEMNIEWLAEDAWIVVQIDPTEIEPVQLKKFYRFDQRKYGSTLLQFYSLHQ
jgi:16S rRNA (guanine(966)-N(2))-methyltransferase RsmD